MVVLLLCDSVANQSGEIFMKGGNNKATPKRVTQVNEPKAKDKVKALASIPLALNDSIWEMDQKSNLLRNYGLLELYSLEAGVKNVPRLMWHRLLMLGESASQSVDGFGAWS